MEFILQRCSGSGCDHFAVDFQAQVTRFTCLAQHRQRFSDFKNGVTVIRCLQRSAEGAAADLVEDIRTVRIASDQRACAVAEYHGQTLHRFSRVELVVFTQRQSIEIKGVHAIAFWVHERVCISSAPSGLNILPIAWSRTVARNYPRVNVDGNDTLEFSVAQCAVVVQGHLVFNRRKGGLSPYHLRLDACNDCEQGHCHADPLEK